MNKALFLFIVFFAVSTFAQVEFPMGSKIVNVTKDPYFAKGDGKNDDTEAIQKALNDHPDGDYIIYLPHGIYKITEAGIFQQKDYFAGAEHGRNDYPARRQHLRIRQS